MSGEKRDHATYELRQGRKKVHAGITNRPLEEREAEHQAKFPGAKATKVGNMKTEAGAREWERNHPRQDLVRKAGKRRSS